MLCSIIVNIVYYNYSVFVYKTIFVVCLLKTMYYSLIILYLFFLKSKIVILVFSIYPNYHVTIFIIYFWNNALNFTAKFLSIKSLSTLVFVLPSKNPSVCLYIKLSYLKSSFVVPSTFIIPYLLSFLLCNCSHMYKTYHHIQILLLYLLLLITLHIYYLFSNYIFPINWCNIIKLTC